jgi:hypothetical protein
MSQYISDVAIYGVALFAAGVGFEVITALIRNSKTPGLPFGRGSSYDSRSSDVREGREDYEIAERCVR